MGNSTCLFLVLAGMFCFAQVQTFRITKTFFNGNLKFTWTNVSTHRNDIKITMDGRESDWIQSTDDKYTVEDVWKYTSVNIRVREFQSTDHPSRKDYNSTYTVSRIDSEEGEAKNLTWTADFFPKSGQYNIYHFHGGMGKTVMQLEYDGAVSADSAKYVYHTRPYNSTNIKFEVKNIALMDAGFYGGGHPQNAARNGQGALLVVKGKPTQPDITGVLNITENSDIMLTCSSNSTSRPSYYRKTVSLNYIWYRNNTVIDSETRMTLRIPRISRDVRFNKYSCQAKESIESEKSEEIQINVWYGPNSVTISPLPPVDKTVSVKDGDYIGPYHCSADCNPPCSIQWKDKLSNGTSIEAESNGSTLLRQQVSKDQVLFRCVAKSTLDRQLHSAMDFSIMLSFDPNLSKNIQTTTIVIVILSTFMVVAIATIIGVAFRQRRKRRLEYKRAQTENERNTTMNATQQQLQADGGSEFPLNDYEKINTTIDEHSYDCVDPK
ncbi:uncharacterized protein LOC125661645 [Ostrea edulis]|uniref:uncharacterized protein LOC125661645 n=1 Tax=Ostrea edulis TaxID=37623 RepID=UPI0024AEB08A|nr:uncharacterized protein LOC125661645 [Ostrea edulis]